MRFTAFLGRKRKPVTANDNRDVDFDDVDAELESAVVDAPAALDRKMNELLRFMTATLTAFGFQRNGVWNEETASQKVEHIGLMFGSLASDLRSTVKGCGMPLDILCVAMLVFPAVCDWYLQCRSAGAGLHEMGSRHAQRRPGHDPGRHGLDAMPYLVNPLNLCRSDPSRAASCAPRLRKVPSWRSRGAER